MMNSENTGQKILEVSLQLFSERGYHAVSIRGICREVRIKESSVYYHFRNKRAILEELRQRFEKTAEGFIEQLDLAVQALSGDGPTEGFAQEKVSGIFFEQYLMNDFCNRFLRLLSIEQHHDEELRALYQKWMFTVPLQFQSRIFNELVRHRLLPAADGEYLAVQYYAPVFLYFQQFLLCGEITDEKKEKFRRLAGTHMDQLFKNNGGV